MLDVGWNADVVIAPATLRYRGWDLMAESAVRRWVLGVGAVVTVIDALRFMRTKDYEGHIQALNGTAANRQRICPVEQPCSAPSQPFPLQVRP